MRTPYGHEVDQYDWGKASPIDVIRVQGLRTVMSVRLAAETRYREELGRLNRP